MVFVVLYCCPCEDWSSSQHVFSQASRLRWPFTFHPSPPPCLWTVTHQHTHTQTKTQSHTNTQTHTQTVVGKDFLSSEEQRGALQQWWRLSMRVKVTRYRTVTRGERQHCCVWVFRGLSELLYYIWQHALWPGCSLVWAGSYPTAFESSDRSTELLMSSTVLRWGRTSRTTTEPQKDHNRTTTRPPRNNKTRNELITRRDYK